MKRSTWNDIGFMLVGAGAFFLAWEAVHALIRWLVLTNG